MEGFRSHVIVRNVLWDSFLVSHEGVTFLFNKNCELSSKITPVCDEQNVHKSFESKKDFQSDLDTLPKKNIRDKLCKLNVGYCSRPDERAKNKADRSLRLFANGYLLSSFVKTLQGSSCFRRSVISHFNTCCQKRKKLMQPQLQVVIKLTYPQRDIIDFAWNERLEILVVERRELENAMSWLSTLGGAFSALGDHFEHCAEMAGRISFQQLKIALRLGDPYTLARCKLYLALSLLQTGHLKCARRIITEQYKLATSPPVLDHRLVRMCLGIWAKLKYEHRRKRTDKQM